MRVERIHVCTEYVLGQEGVVLIKACVIGMFLSIAATLMITIRPRLTILPCTDMEFKASKAAEMQLSQLPCKRYEPIIRGMAYSCSVLTAHASEKSES
jgi:hypothetical protein